MLKKKIETGFTLLEMMVALVIVSVGLLGVATLQTRGQQFNQVSYLRTQATFLATDIMERIRINTDKGTNISGGNGDNGSYQIPSCDSVSSSTCDADVGGCFPVDLATYDLNQWCDHFQQTLPQGQAIIQFNNGIYTIYICWKNIVGSKQDNEICTDTMEEQKWELQLY